jgi:porin
MILPILFAAALVSTNAAPSAQPATTPSGITMQVPAIPHLMEARKWRFELPMQIPGLAWNIERFYHPYDPSMDNTKNWLDSSYATMNWFGFRDMLATNGLDISFNYASDIAGNVTGGKSQGMSYCDNFTLDLEFHSEQLLGYKGGTLSVIMLNRDGNNLSQMNIGNQFTVQQLYGGSTAIFYSLAYDQHFFDDKVSFKFGRMAAGDDFSSSPLYWLYMNNGIDGNPQALPVNAKFTAYPWASWAARLRAKVTSTTEAMVGVYQVTPQVWRASMHGFNWNMNPQDGVMLIGQYGWAPEFFKPAASTTPATSDGKSTVAADGKATFAADGKSFAPAADSLDPKGLPGHYWMGGYYSTWTYPQFNSTQGQTGAYGLYWHFDQMLYRMNPFKDTGLTAWSAFILSPQQNTAKIPFQYNGGLVYTGMIPFRPQDLTIFGVIYGNFSSNYAQANQATAGGYATYELVYELGYRINMTKFAYIQPDAQWIINPAGTGTIQNALVLGAQIGVTF